MKRYIEQLIEDLRNAALQAPPDVFDDPELDDEDALEMELEEAERFVTGPFEKLSDIVGVSKKLLPAPERLTEQQKMLLIPEIEKLLHAWHFYPEYPENVPSGLLYKAIYNIWDNEYVRINSGQCHIEFCDYEEENCPFPGFCNYCSELTSKEEAIPENDFNVKANDLKGDEENIHEDFEQIEKEYYKDEEIMDEEGFIPGIHNYCDRWCERCDFTDKCRVFAMEAEMMEMLKKKHEESGETHESNEWQGALTSDEEEAEDEPEIEVELPDDLDAEIGEEGDDFFSAQKKAGRHPLAQQAYEYSMTSFNWFSKRNRELSRNFTAQVARGYADEVMNALEVMQWYHMFIFTKMKRALSGYYEMEDFEDADYDMNGSAKVALIGVDRSIEAATTLMRLIKAYRDDIKNFRDQLEKIRNMAEEVFPEARDFVRPGLDEL